MVITIPLVMAMKMLAVAVLVMGILAVCGWACKACVRAQKASGQEAEPLIIEPAVPHRTAEGGKRQGRGAGHCVRREGRNGRRRVARQPKNGQRLE